MKRIIPFQRSGIASGMLLLLLTATPQLFSQADAEPSIRLHASGGYGRNPADHVTALDVFLACRHTKAFSNTTQLGQFCRLRLPTNREPRAQEVQTWVTAAAPSAVDIRAYRDDVRNLMNRRLSNLRSRFSYQTLPGLVLSDAADTLVAAAAERIKGLASTVEADSVRLRFSGSDSALAERIAASFSQLGIRKVRISRDSTAQAGAGLGGVSIQIGLPVIDSLRIPALGAIRFAPGEVDLDEGRLMVVAGAAKEIDTSPIYLNGGTIRIVLPRDPGNGTQFAARAEALRRAFADNGVEPGRLEIAPGSVESTATAAAPAPAAGPFTISSGSGTPSVLAVQPASPALAGGLSLGWENVALAATQAITEQAKKQIEAYTLTTFSARLCALARTTLVETCTVLLDRGADRYVPSLETVRDLVRHDMQRAPELLLSGLLARELPGTAGRLAPLMARLDALQNAPLLDTTAVRVLTDSVRTAQNAFNVVVASWRPSDARLALALYGLDFARRVHRGESAVAALDSFPAWLRSLPDTPELQRLNTNPAIMGMARFVSFVHASRDAADQLRSVSRGVADRDTLFRYALLTLRVNGDTPELRGDVGRLVNAGRQIEAVIPALDSIRDQIAALRVWGESGNERRRELYAEALAAMVRIGAAGFVGASNDLPAEEIQRMQESVSELLLALQSEQYSLALRHSLVILRYIAPPPASPCVPNACGSGFQEQARVLALAADMSEAATEEQLRQAMTRFVGSGGGLQGKRSGTPRRGVYLNSYVGAGFGSTVGGNNSFQASLPIGVEVVDRDPFWRGMTISGMVQVVDLGGFLPQSGDDASVTSDERLASVITPGLFAMLSGGTFPISVGFGITSDTRIEADEWKTRLRFVVSAGVDVPLLRIR